MFTGALTAMVTPFKNGKLDEARLVQQINHQLDGGIDGLVPLGTTGESPTLDHAERARVIEVTIETVAGKVPVIVGAGGNCTAEAIELHRHAKSLGASAALSVNPYYNKPSQEGLYRHFMAIAEAVDLPIVLYNVPGRSSVSMSPATVARLSSHPNIVAIKEASGSIDQASEIMSLCDLPILSGDDSLTVALMSIGARGVISVVSNLLPDRIKQLTSAALSGDFATARAIHQKLFPLTKTLFADGNPGGIKCAMRLAGLDSGEMRLPLVQVSEIAARAIAEHASPHIIGREQQPDRTHVESPALTKIR